MTTSSLLIHVGYHKTATTWLQGNVFVAEHGFPQVLSHNEIFDLIIMPHGLSFAPQEVIARLSERRHQGSVGSTDVISLEALVGHPFYGGRESDGFAQRLKEIAPDALILITIREQVRMIASVYMQYLRRGGTLSAERFFDGETVGGYFGFDAVHFEYDRLVALYQRLFGVENVAVLTMECIAKDQAEAVRRIAEFSGNHEIGPWQTQPTRGVGAPEGVAWALRRINHLQSGPAHREPLLDLKGMARFAYRATERLGKDLKLASRPVTEIARRRYGSAFAQSNLRLGELIDAPDDLSGYQGFEDG